MFPAESCLAIGGSADNGHSVDLENDQMFLDFQDVLLAFLVAVSSTRDSSISSKKCLPFSLQIYNQY